MLGSTTQDRRAAIDEIRGGLPDELLYEIVDYLRPDKHVLKACSQVSRSWCAYVTPIIFRRFSWPPCRNAWRHNFGPPGFMSGFTCQTAHGAGLQALHQSLLSSPRLCGTIQDLRISSRCDPSYSDIQLGTVRAIVDLLPKLAALEFLDCRFGRAADETIQDHFTRTPLKELRFNGNIRCGNTLNSLDELKVQQLFSSIGRLVLGSFEVALMYTPEEDGDPIVTPVHSLVVDIPLDAYASYSVDAARALHFCRLLDAPAVRELTLSHPFVSHVALLTSSWPNLRSLAYVAGFNLPILSPSVSSTLESLTIAMRLYNEVEALGVEGCVTLGWEWLIRGLESTTALDLTTLGVVFLLPYPGTPRLPDEFGASLRNCDWTRLEHTIVQKFPKLRTIRMQVGSHTGGWKGPIVQRCGAVIEEVARSQFSPNVARLLDTTGFAQDFVSIHIIMGMKVASSHALSTGQSDMTPGDSDSCGARRQCLPYKRHLCTGSVRCLLHPERGRFMHFTELLARLERCGIALTPDGEWASRQRRLPEELLFEILDHLRSDRSALKTCSCVCRSWCTYLTPILFRRISWPPCHSAWYDAFRVSTRCPRRNGYHRSNATTIDVLYKNLSRSARVRTAVQELRLRGECCSAGELLSFEKVRAMVTLLPQMSALELREIRSDDDQFAPPIKPALRELRIFEQYCTPEIAVHAMHFFSRIDRLVIGSFNAVFDPIPIDHRPPERPSLHVRALATAFEDDGSAARHLDGRRDARPFCLYLDPLALRELTLCNPFRPYMAPLAGSWPDLRSLAYILGEDTPRLAPQAARTLRSLTLGMRLAPFVEFATDRTVEEWVVDGWAYMLRDLKDTRAVGIHELEIVFLFGCHANRDTARTLDTVLRQKDWDSLERVLVRRFPQLQRVRLQAGSHGRAWAPAMDILERCSEVVGTVAESMFSSRIASILDIGIVSHRYPELGY